MLYPAYIHKGDETHAHGAELPDFPGCFSAADSWEDLPSAIQEAVEVYCEGEDMSLPKPSAIDDRDDGGMWIFVDIDLSKLDTRKQRINLSVPTNALQEIDEYASAHGQNRSVFMVQASLQVARAS